MEDLLTGIGGGGEQSGLHRGRAAELLPGEEVAAGRTRGHLRQQHGLSCLRQRRDIDFPEPG